jgi:alpha-D-xyloside xylohydrolase
MKTGKLLFIVIILLSTVQKNEGQNEYRASTAVSGAGRNQMVKAWKKQDNALWIETTGGTLYLQPLATGSLHVQYGTEEAIGRNKSYAVTNRPEVAAFEVSEDSESIILNTAKLKAMVSIQGGHISLYDHSGKLLVQESPDGARCSPAGDSIKPYDKFRLHPSDALYGLGQFRDHKLNLRNVTRELVQFNTQAAVPVVYSTGGWGLLWDNPSRTVFTDDGNGMSFSSDYGDKVDYYLFTGVCLDSLISAYRTLTGRAPMLADWALGYHQSRNKYATQREVLDVAARMKEENIPMSSIFIDYFYWQNQGTGSHRFDESLFPDVQGMIDSLHRVYDTKIVLTVWPTFQPGIPNYEELHRQGGILEGAVALDGFIYDAFNPEAGQIYWKQVSPLVGQGIDGWFLDGPEPDNVPSFLSATTYAGPAGTVRNLYPLVHATTFYNGLLKARPNLRPYILTRCAWISQQRVGTAIWSGDIPATFEELEQQVTAGLNFTATGIPYWTTDIGGYSGGDPADEAYRELFTRWFQYGTFCPVFRSHGRRYPGDRKTSNELWAYGDEVKRICTDFIRLRYALLPYIYTLTSQVTHADYTPMRLLAFDFPEDVQVLDCKDQFMYGTAFMICPVLKAGLVSRKVYLPEGNSWIDFWTGKTYSGGRHLDAPAPAERIPVYVRAGSVIPFYTSLQKHVTTEIPTEIRIYAGNDGSFELYEDDGNTFNYEQEAYSRISFLWNEKAQTLTVGNRKGKYGEKERIFHINLISEAHPNRTKTITYKGETTTLQFE